MTTRVNIIGCGPTGMTIAWELSKHAEVHVYDKKPGPGGSWWEPDGFRDLHATRSVFNGAFVNTRSLFDEMGLTWSKYFGILENESPIKTLVKNLKPKDYYELVLLSAKVLVEPAKYSQKTLHESIGTLSTTGEVIVSSLPYIMDGVSWDKMTAYEFVKSYDWVGLSTQETQITSGPVMCRDMEMALSNRGVYFHYNTEIAGVRYGEVDHEATITDTDKTIKGNLLVLAVDHGQAKWLVGDNWGHAYHVLNDSQYQAVSLLLEYPYNVKLRPQIEGLISTPWHIIASVLPDGKSVCVVLTDLTSPSEYGRTVGRSPPEDILTEVHLQTGLPRAPTRMCWGSQWDGNQWVHHQTSGVMGVGGSIPFWGRCPSVALCGMMSPRNTPFASIEAAVEVGRRFVGKTPLKPVLVSDLLIGLLFLVILNHLISKQS